MMAPTPCLWAATHRVVCRGDKSRQGSKIARGWLGERWDKQRSRTGMTWQQQQRRNQWWGGEMRGRAGKGKGRQQHWPHKAPPTTATSNCSWGGKGCYVSGMAVGWRQGDRGEEGDKGMTSTLHHHHKQLLMGWLWCVSAWEWWETGMGGWETLPMHWQWHEHTLPLLWAADDIPCICKGFLLFILFHLKLVVTSPLPVKRGGITYSEEFK